MQQIINTQTAYFLQNAHKHTRAGHACIFRGTVRDGSRLIEQVNHQLLGDLGLGNWESGKDMGHPVEYIGAVGDSALIQHPVELHGVGIEDLPGAVSMVMGAMPWGSPKMGLT